MLLMEDGSRGSPAANAD